MYVTASRKIQKHQNFCNFKVGSCTGVVRCDRRLFTVAKIMSRWLTGPECILVHAATSIVIPFLDHDLDNLSNHNKLVLSI